VHRCRDPGLVGVSVTRKNRRNSGPDVLAADQGCLADAYSIYVGDRVQPVGRKNIRRDSQRPGSRSPLFPLHRCNITKKLN
jgi:hypothetical protein